MSKLVRRLNRADPLDKVLSRGDTRRERAHMEGKHKRWPLSTPVVVNTPEGFRAGRVFKHWRSSEAPHGCSVEFQEVVDFGDANGRRFCHVIPFRNIRPTGARGG